MSIWQDVCGLGASGILEVLDGLEGKNGFAMVELVIGHIDITGTRAVGLDKLSGVEVVVVVAAVLGVR